VNQGGLAVGAMPGFSGTSSWRVRVIPRVWTSQSFTLVGAGRASMPHRAKRHAEHSAVWARQVEEFLPSRGAPTLSQDLVRPGAGEERLSGLKATPMLSNALVPAERVRVWRSSIALSLRWRASQILIEPSSCKTAMRLPLPVEHHAADQSV